MTAPTAAGPRLRLAATQLRYLPRTLDLVFRAAPAWTMAWGAMLVVQGLLPVAIVYLTRALVDAMVAAIDSGAAPGTVRPAIVYVALMAGVLLVREVFRVATTYVRTAQSEYVEDHINDRIHRHSAEADLAFYESPEFYDHLHRARFEARHRPIELLENVGRLLQDGITLVAMALVLLPYGWWLPLALLASTAPALWIVLRHAIRRHAWRRRVTADERRAHYYDWMLTSGHAAAELRLFGLGGPFREAYRSIRRRLRGERLDLVARQAWAEVAAAVFGLAVTGVALAWMAWRAIQGQVTLGDLALFYQAFDQGQRMMRSLLHNTGQIYANVLFLGDLYAFLDLEPEIRDAERPVPIPAPLVEGIHFDGVGFRYPGASRDVLRGFDLHVPAGKTVAIVGPNGSGKSTIVKLLCRFYDPFEGVVRLDGTDIREIALDDLRRHMAVLFQEPVHYNDTAAANVDVAAVDAPDAARRERAAWSARADQVVERLPAGWDTQLGKWFVDGTELSTGEWQRIALARAMMRDAPVLCLDEPTSAMDSWTEAEWIARFRRETAGRTVILITHRFTTAMHADLLYVMEEGKIVESGRHGELLARGGRYAAGWMAQLPEAELGAGGGFDRCP